MIEFFIHGKPQGKARARTFYDKRTHSVRSITPPDTVKYEQAVKNSYIIACNDLKASKESGESILEKYQWMDKEPIAIEITAQFGVPVSYTKKRKESIKQGSELPVKKPDADNIAKIICDALNELAYYDDTQIVVMDVKKVYVQENQKEGVWVTLRDISEIEAVKENFTWERD